MAAILSATNLADDAATLTLTAGTEIAEFPLSNLLTQQPSEVFRAPDLTNTTFQCQLTASAANTPINLIALLNTTAETDAEWSIAVTDAAASPTASLSATQLWAQTDLDAWPYRHAIWYSASPVNAFVVTVAVRHLSAPAGTALDIGRLWIGNAWVAPKGPLIRDGGWTTRWIEDAPGTRTRGGQLFVESGGKRRQCAMTIRFATEAQAESSLAPFALRAGRSRAVFVSADPTHATLLQSKSAYGLLAADVEIAQDAGGTWSGRVAVEELI